MTAPGLAASDQALALSLRGREYRHAKRYQQALTDCTGALALDPDLDRAYFGRGLTHRFLDHYADAVSDLSHAIELSPDDSEYIASRGAAY
ncbi:tetratricopeptide repeat protein [Streptomyces violascens]|uniref:tetratricopeptide repeat protein n=1 Tax=Streptomyces violascens TaxID=67381 RepID=UPI00167B4EE9|nr:tetratricopeptide repeat protein [Streptomyces violascens]GGU30168.1 hypothetical protein GCM10010289_59490 [Streptomyces violascens]